MNPNQPQPPVSDAAAMSAAINALPPAPAPQMMGGQPPIAPPAAPAAPAPAPEGDGFFGNPPAAQPYIPQYPTPPAMPPVPGAPQAPAPQAPAAPAVPPVPDPNAIPIGLPVPPAAPAPAAPANDTPAWAQEVIDAAAQIKAAQSGQPAPGTVPAAAPGQPAAQPDAWKPNDWQDVDKRIEERAQQLFQNGWSQFQAQQQAQAEAETQALAEADRAIDGALEQLRQTGYLPPITDPSNREDAGVAAQRELIAYTISQGTDDLTKTAPTLYALHQSGYFYDPQQNKLVRRGSQTAAAQAPIAGATPSVSAPQAGQITYADLARRDLSSVADMAAQAYPTTGQDMNL